MGGAVRNLRRRVLQLPAASALQKRWLRHRIDAMPLGDDAPIDVELRLLRTLDLDGAVLDVGANTGQYSVALEDVVRADRLYLFEPVPHLAAMLRRRFRRSHVVEVALSGAPGRATLRVPYIDGRPVHTRATLNRHVETHQTGADEVTVRLDTLDRQVAALGIGPIALIKIDVEGHELDVIAGAVATLASQSPLLLVEIEARHHAFPIAEVFARLEGLGYEGWVVDPAGRRVIGTADFSADAHQRLEDLEARRFSRYLNNFFFVPAGDPHRVVEALTAVLAAGAER